MVEQFKDCVECRACEQICPQACIRFLKNGKINIDTGLCIQCGMCDKVCQVIQAPAFNDAGLVYAACCKDENLIKISSSGGIANIIGRNVLERGGVVFGAKYNDKLQPVIDFAEDIEGFNVFLQSKYVFSNVNDAYRKCKAVCESGRKAVFIGLPCQTGGLKLYLQREYDNLVTIDILCHGAPHYSIFENHILYLQNKRKKHIDNYRFRDKENDNLGPYHYKITFSDGETETGSALWDAYYNSFLKADIFRDACYSCKYSRRERVSDITLGDFWRAPESINELKERKYISSVIVSTARGAELINNISEQLYIYESCFEELEKSTHAVVCPADKKSYIGTEKLQDFKYYCRWADNYENSPDVVLRKLKWKVIKKMSK